MNLLEATLWALGALAACLFFLAYIYRERIAVADMRDKAPGRFQRLSNGVTHFTDSGPRGAEVVLLVPGATLGLWVWADLPERLVEAGYRVISFDLYGRGYSDRPNVPYNAELFDRQIADLLTALNVTTPINIIGLAFGCPISANFSLRHPEKVKRICFFGPDGFGVVMTRMARVVQTRYFGSFLFRLVGNKALIARLAGYSSRPEVLAWLRKNYEPDLQLKGFKRALLSSIRNMPIHDARHLYGKVDRLERQFMLIWGREDFVTPVPDNFDPSNIFPNAQIHLLADTGHLPHVDAKAETERLLFAFLRNGAAVAAAAK